MIHPDIVIVGGGIAGASLGAVLASRASVVILEQEPVAGYHATGRSVAFWEETYGGPGIQPLTTVSGALLASPDPEFYERSFLTPRQTLHIGRAKDAHLRDALVEQFRNKVELVEIDPHTILQGLRNQWTIGLLEPNVQDIDVASLHSAYVRQFQKRGGIVRTGCEFLSAHRSGNGWRVQTSGGEINCAILVNAAGAWADHVATASGILPLAIQPLRRTVAQLRVALAVDPQSPLVMDLGQRFYFKPEAEGRIWLTPHDEVPSAPCDAAPEEVAVAEAIARFEEAVTWPVVAVERKWAGLRSFSPDRLPVYGYDQHVDNFFWFAGQGGFGIQTSPAAALIAGALLWKEKLPTSVNTIDVRAYDPNRFG